jgi:hypothetical protein
MPRFLFQYHHEPSPGWTLTFEGETEANTLADAWDNVHHACGDKLFESLDRPDGWDWIILAAQPGERMVPVDDCPLCGGHGKGPTDRIPVCVQCNGVGYLPITTGPKAHPASDAPA